MLVVNHVECRWSQKTASGIFLPSSSTNNPLPEATVIAVGPGAPNKDGNILPVSVKAGDRVLLPGWGGSPIKVGEEVSWHAFWTLSWQVRLVADATFARSQEYFLFRDSEILAKIQE